MENKVIWLSLVDDVVVVVVDDDDDDDDDENHRNTTCHQQESNLFTISFVCLYTYLIRSLLSNGFKIEFFEKYVQF